MAKAISLILYLIVIFCTGCTTKKQLSILVHMYPDQEDFFRDEIVSGFPHKKSSHLTVTHYANVNNPEFLLKKSDSSIALVEIPLERSFELMNKGYFVPLESFLDSSELKKYEQEYLDFSLLKINKKTYVIPRKLETRIMVFSKSKVAEAVASIDKFYDPIDSVLQSINGFGLPSDFNLESNPEEWDFFDIFAIGWIWAHTPFDGKLKPRIAYSGKRNAGTQLIDRVFQLGADSVQMTSVRGDAVADAIFWEALYAFFGIYDAGMWKENWGCAEIWKGFSSGDLFLTFAYQLDCFFFHGTGRGNMNGFFQNPEDMGVAVMPQGNSCLLDARGKPMRQGVRAVATGGWWWGIPASTPDPRLSFKIFEHISSSTSQIKECTNFGMIPVRKDVLADMSMFFGGSWISQVYDVSLRQLMFNGNSTIPFGERSEMIISRYLKLWDNIIVESNWSEDRSVPDFNYIANIINIQKPL